MNHNYADRKHHERFEKIREWRRMRDLARSKKQIKAEKEKPKDEPRA